MTRKIVNSNDAVAIAKMAGKKTVFAIRGLPGHERNELAEAVANELDDSVCFGFDDYFRIDPETDVRMPFNPDYVSAAHEHVRAKALGAFGYGIPAVVISNPFLNKSQLGWFAQRAEEKGYEFIVVTPSDNMNLEELADESGTPLNVLQRLAVGWEVLTPTE